MSDRLHGTATFPMGRNLLVPIEEEAGLAAEPI
jgi:hypothetical protein